ncbi:MAG: hypothetical protein KME54_14415 [Tolypothrix brevis GSE-NOS-MK-07-07A]|nr:hypothetical protein [Tolypothrix brevis GSE-NOS-MK-07-07A]
MDCELLSLLYRVNFLVANGCDRTLHEARICRLWAIGKASLWEHSYKSSELPCPKLRTERFYGKEKKENDG